MILSSADILQSLGGSEIIRLAARLKIVDRKPVLSGDECLYVCVGRFPNLDEFEATWTIWIEGEGEEELVIQEIKRLLPSVKVLPGLVTELTTTDFRSEHTQAAPKPSEAIQASQGVNLDEKFETLAEDIHDRMLLVNSGRDGKDGNDGRDGRDGVDGKDLLATDADLFDLNDVEKGIQLQPGQVLTWDGSKWTNLYVRQTTTYVGGGGGSSNGGGSGNGQINSDTITSDTPPTQREDGKGALRDGDTWWKSDSGALFVYYIEDGAESGVWVEVEGGGGGQQGPQGEPGEQGPAGVGVPTGGATGQVLAKVDGTDYNTEWIDALAGGGGIEEAPEDGNFYVRQNGAWINLSAALSALNDKIIDGGNLATGSSQGDDEIVDGGDFTSGTAYYTD